MRAGTDRQTILARRAMFLATALSGLGAGGPAHAAPACPPPRAPTRDEILTARMLFEEARLRTKDGAYEEAIRHLEEAYALTSNSKVKVTLAQVAKLAQDWARAHTEARSALECAEPALDERAREIATDIVTEAEPRIGRIAVGTTPDGAELVLDGKSVGTTPLAEPLVVNPGRHELNVRWPATRVGMTQVVVVAAAQQQNVTLTAPPADPCLNEPCVCLQPCLEPPLERVRRRRFGVGLGYSAWLDVIDDDLVNTGHGARAQLFFDFPLGELVTVRGGLSTLPTRTEAGTLVPIGIELALLVTPRPLVLGVSASQGYVWSGDDADRNQRHVARSGVFIHPELVVGLELSERFTLGARGGPFLSGHDRGDTASFRAGWITAGAFLTYSFGAACQGYGDPVPCDELEATGSSASR